MDYALSEEQEAVQGAVASLMGRYAGPIRAREMTNAHDDRVLNAMLEAGFLDLATDPDTGPLTAALVTETCAEHLAAAHIGARSLVAPQLLDAPPARVALAVADQLGPIRFGGDADILLVLDGDDARVVEPLASSTQTVETGYIYPFATTDLAGGRVLPGAGPTLAKWWRIAIASELAGLLQPALDRTVAYLKQREQFGKPLGSLQALQHRLAEAHVWVEGTCWSARAAAWNGGDEAAATAATYASMAARHVASEMHQLTGALSFTAEHDLHLWTLRAQALRTELGGIGGHAAAVTQLRWASLRTPRHGSA